MDTGPKNRLDRIFEAAPWLKESKNIIHMPVPDPDSKTGMKPLPGVTWAEIYQLIYGR